MTTHGEALRNADIQLVRIDVDLPRRDDHRSFNRARSLADQGIQIMAIVKSQHLSPYRGAWGTDWDEYVGEVVERFDPYVDYWQIDNELNHPGHALHPSLRSSVRSEIVSRGCKVIRDASDAATVVNLVSFWGMDFLTVRYVDQLESLAQTGVQIDILGIDSYRRTYAPGGPHMYPQDLVKAKRRWSKEILMTETGFSAPLLLRTEEDQNQYFRSVFEALHNDGFREANPWFLGTLVYVYGCDANLPSPEYRFGMLRPDGTPKPAWLTVAEEARRLRSDSLIFGVTSHVNEYEQTDRCPKREVLATLGAGLFRA